MNDPMVAFAAELRRQINAVRTSTSQGKVTAVAGGEVSFSIGPNQTALRGRWVGSRAPRVGEIVTWLNDGTGYPIVFGPTGIDKVTPLHDWVPYTVAWTTTGAQPAIGDGWISGLYMKADGWVMVEITMAAGNSTNFGTGEFRFSLPFPPVNNGGFHEIGGHFNEPDFGLRPITGMIPSGVQYVVPMYHGAAGAFVDLVHLTSTSALAPSPGDRLHMLGAYRTV